MPDKTLTTISHLSIREAAEKLGVSIKTLRRWESHGLVHPIRNILNQRTFDSAEIDNLINRKYKPLPESAVSPQNYQSISQAADAVGVSVKTLRRWDSEGKLSLERDELNRRVFTPETIDYIKSNRPLLAQSTVNPAEKPNIQPEKIPTKPKDNLVKPGIPAVFTPFLGLLPFVLVILPILLFSLLGYKPSLPLQSPDLSKKSATTINQLNPNQPRADEKLSTATNSAATLDNPILQRVPRGEVAGVTVSGGSLLSFENILDNNYNFGVAGSVEGSQLVSTSTVKAPLIVASKELVSNLNADLLDGHTWEEIESVAIAPLGLQKSYEAGNTITTTTANISFTLNTGTAFTTDGPGSISFNNTGSMAIAGNLNAAGGIDITGNDLTVGGNRFTVNVSNGDTNIAGDLAIGGGDLTTSQSTASLFNSTATSVNIGGAATSLNLGAGSGTTTVNNGLTISGALNANGAINLGDNGDSLTTNASTATFNATGNILIRPSGDSDDYVYFSTSANEAGIFFAGATGSNDPGLRVNSSGQFQYRDQGSSTWQGLGAGSQWTDGGAYITPTSRESVRVYDSTGADFIDVAHNGTDVLITTNGTTQVRLDSSLRVAGNIYADSVSSAADNDRVLTVDGTTGLISYLNTNTWDKNLFDDVNVASVGATVQAYNTNTSLLGQTIEESELNITNGPSNSYLLQTDGSGNLTWVDPSTIGGGGGYLSLSDQQLFPTNTSLDILLGGNSTAAATIALQAGSGNVKSTSADVGSLRLDGTTLGLASDTDLLSLSATALTVKGTLTVESAISAPTIGTINNLNINDGTVSNLYSLTLRNTENTWTNSGDLAVSNDLTASHFFTRDTDRSNTMQIRWNEDDTANRILDFYLAGANRQLTINENFTIGDGAPGILTFSNPSTLTVENNSYINQDLTTDTSPTFAGLTVNSVSLNSYSPYFIDSAGSNGQVWASDGSGRGNWIDSTEYFQLNNEQLSPANSLWNDLMIGGTSTASSTIALQANTGNITTTGNMGVGTKAPTTLLHLSSTDPKISFTDTDLSHSGTIAFNSYAGNYRRFEFSTGTTGGLFNIQSQNVVGDVTTDLVFGSNQSDDSNFVLEQYSGENMYIQTRTPRAGGGDIIFRPNEQELMRMTVGGLVGIGDTTPASLFTVGNGDLFQINSSGSIVSLDGIAHTIDDVGGNLTLTSNSSTISLADSLSVAGSILPSTTNSYDLGSDTLRFRDAYLSGTTLHIGDSTTDEATIGYNPTTNVLGISTDSTTNGDISFFNNDLYLDKSTHRIGLGTDAPTQTLDVNGNVQIQGGLILTPQSSMALTTEGTLYYDNDSDHLYIRTGTSYHRLGMDVTQYSSTSANIANDGYVEIVHNQNTNEVSLEGWVKSTLTGFWEKITGKSVTVKQSSQSEYDAAAASGLIRTQTRLTDVELKPSVDTGSGADGAITVSGDTNINTTHLITSRSSSCPDAPNYSVTALTSTTATVTPTPDTANGCLSAGDEVLLINLQGTTSAYGNVGNYETLRISTISTNTITFTTSKTKYYGNSAADDTNLGVIDGTQRVMLQRVPNYTTVIVDASRNFYPSAWDGAKGGVMFFRASTTVTANGTIHASAKGYRGGSGGAGSGLKGVGGESYCAALSGGSGGNSNEVGNNGVCGGGGGGGSYNGTYAGGSGTASLGGAGGGGGGSNDTSNGAYGGGGGGGGYGGAGTYGTGGNSGTSGGTNSSGNGGAGYIATSIDRGGGGGGGGTFGDTSLSTLMFGSSGGGGGATEVGSADGVGGAGGGGGGVVVIAANSITIAGGVKSDGGAGVTCGGTYYGGGGGGGAGGSVKLMANTLNLGSSVVTSTGGAAGSCPTYPGGTGGVGRTAIYYTTSYAGSATSPTPTYTNQPYYPYGLYHSGVINTQNATGLSDLTWDAATTAYGKVTFQTRTGNTTDPTDGTWEAWKPMDNATNYLTLQSTDTHTDWTGTNMTVSEGDVTRNVDMFEDEDEATAANITQLNSSTNGGYAESTIASTDISVYDYLTFWVRSSQVGNTVQIGMGESAATEASETVTIDATNTWQKVYWDLSDIPLGSRDAITTLRLANLTTSSNTIYIDNIKAERVMTGSSGTQIKSTPNNYFQYRAILATTNTSYQPKVNSVQFSYNNGYKMVQVDSNTVRMYNQSGTTQELRLNAVIFGADLAEWYAVDNQSIEGGDVVAMTGLLDDSSIPVLRKATASDDQSTVGIISTKAGQTLGLESSERRLLALAGRVPLKVASSSAAINVGDYVSSSAVPGRGQKAQWGDQIIGKALESWSPTSGTTTVTVLVSSAHTYIPVLTSSWDQVSSQVQGVIAVAQAVIDNLTTNHITSVSIDTDQFSTNTATVSGHLTAETASISGLVAGTIDVATISAQTFYAAEIISPTIDNAVSTLSARISILETQVASPGAALYPASPQPNDYSSLESQIASLSARLNDPLRRSESEASQTISRSHDLTDYVATESALVDTFVASPASSLSNDVNLDTESIFVSDLLSVMGDAILTKATVATNLTTPSITSATGNLTLLGDLLSLDSIGNLVTIHGNLAVTGTTSLNQLTTFDATISGTLSAPAIDQLNVQIASLSAHYRQLEEKFTLSEVERASLSAQIASLSGQLVSPPVASSAGEASPSALLEPSVSNRLQVLGQ